jgi:hypothetical protein
MGKKRELLLDLDTHAISIENLQGLTSPPSDDVTFGPQAQEGPAEEDEKGRLADPEDETAEPFQTLETVRLEIDSEAIAEDVSVMTGQEEETGETDFVSADRKRNAFYSRLLIVSSAIGLIIIGIMLIFQFFF